jgi:sugar transferase (PEP-CTERM/EpsH1 system associated)
MHVVRHGFAGGGMENGVINVANGLPPERFRISVCALDSTQTFSERIRAADAEYHLLPKLGVGVHWGLVWRLAGLLRRAKVDLVHSHNWATFLYAVLAAELVELPIVHGEHGKNPGELDETNRPKQWAKRLLGRRVNRLVTVSHAIANEWAGYGIPAHRIQWIPNGVDIERFRPRTDRHEQRRRFGLPDGGFILGSVGRMDILKNYEVLLDAFAHFAPDFPDWHLALLGDGPCAQRLRRKVAELSLEDRVHLPGRQPDPENFLAALDLFVLPSKTEGMSNVVLEAMASGLPVVCNDLPCHHEVFEPEQEGVLVSPCTAEALADAVSALCRDPERRRSLGLAARNKAVARFNVARMVSDYERLYAEYERPVPQHTEKRAVVSS